MKKLIIFILFLPACAIQHKRGPDPEIVIQTYRSHLEGPQQCYEHLLKQEPKAQGEVTLEWSVDDRGRVRKPNILATDLTQADFTECLISHLKSLPFSPTKPWSRATVAYTLRFSREGQSLNP